MEKLARSASGSRHVRWGREIFATMTAHQAVNTTLSDDQKKALDAEIVRVGPRVEALAAAVVPYRNFVENAHVAIRAKQRVANFLCDEAQRHADGALRPYRSDINSVLPSGYSTIHAKNPLSRVLRVGHEKTADLAEHAAGVIRSLPAKIPGTGPLADKLDGAAALLRGFIKEGDDLEKQRLPLKSAVNKAIFELREELDQMDGRLRSYFSAEFIDSLYPELSRKGTAVADEQDEDDDTTEAPEK